MRRVCFFSCTLLLYTQINSIWYWRHRKWQKQTKYFAVTVFQICLCSTILEKDSLTSCSINARNIRIRVRGSKVRHSLSSSQPEGFGADDK